ncbi:MAG: DUF2339 domain-containing protein [Verrucomicrobiota bacterium]
MNEQERSELDRLKQLHQLLAQQLDGLGSRIDRLQNQLAAHTPPLLDSVRPVEIPALPIPDLASSDPIHLPTSQAQPSPPLEKPKPLVVPEIVGAVPPLITQTNLPAATTELLTPSISPEQKPFVRRIPPEISKPPAAAPDAKGSFEMRLGTYWLVRVGIVLLLTWTVFFARYAYQNYFGHLGPLGKVLLMYGASGLLLGAGTFLQRKQPKESLRNYGQVLFAGGLALVYFTTYAAHHVANLRVISNAVLDGALLLGWTAFIVWIADRKKSEVLALFAIGLAYYTSIITTIGLFTLYSNLLLTVAAVFFLLRNRWTRLSFTSLVATYVAFVFWRFYSGEGWLWSWRTQEVWKGNWFLAGYWVVFTASTFLSREEAATKSFRVPFLTLNNSAFFGLVVASMYRVQHGNFWKFSIGFGAVLIGLAWLARRVLAKDAEVKNGYLTQGLLLVTLGIISYFSGLRLALVLAAESVVLFILGSARGNLFLQAGAYVAAALATLWGFSGMVAAPEILTGCAIAGLLLFNAFWARRKFTGTEGKTVLHPPSVYFVLLALLLGMITTWENCPRESLAPVLAIETLLFTASIYLMRTPELVAFGQSYLIFAQLFWIGERTYKPIHSPWWNSAILIVATLALSHWWQRQKRVAVSMDVRNLLLGFYALAVTGVLVIWLKPIFTPEVWVALTCLLAVALTIYGIVTRFWLLAATAQIVMFLSIGSFFSLLTSINLTWYLALSPIVTLSLIGGTLGRFAWAETSAAKTVISFTAIYRWTALLMTLAWVYQYIPPYEQFWVLMLLGTAIFLLAAWLQNREMFFFSAVLFLAGLGVFLVRSPHREMIFHWPSFLALLVLPALQQLTRRHPEKFPLITPEIHAATIVTGAVLFWIYLSRLVTQTSQGAHFFLTASWAGLALVFFVAGLLLKERIYRWSGLAILGCAVARVFLSDVWKLETIYRILSFMALGLVLLVLGFLYNKYQEKFKDWI